MKKIAVVLGILSMFGVAFAIGAWAQDLPWSLERGTKFIGANVQNAKGEDLGDIKDIVIDRATGRITYAVVSFGGFMGLGEKLFAVPWGAFSQSTSQKNTFLLTIDQERLGNAPGFDQNNWPQMVNRDWIANLYTYYNVPPYWTTAPVAAPMASAMVKNVDPAQRTITLQVDERTLQNLQAGDSAQVTISKDPAMK